MGGLEAELERARSLSVESIADAIESIGFECTRCGECCTAETTPSGETDPHTATVFPDEIRTVQVAAADEGAYDWQDVARPMPYGLDDETGAASGETFEWALQTDACGDCVFYDEADDGTGACTVHEDRPLICRTYPFSIGPLGDAPGDGSEVPDPMGGGVVERRGDVRAHECEGLGRDISRAEARELAAALKERTVRELEEAIGVRDSYEPTDARGVVVHDSEGQKRPDGTAIPGDAER